MTDQQKIAEHETVLGWLKANAPGGWIDNLRKRAEANDAFIDHLREQIRFSEETFGPGERLAGISDHIRKELDEVAKAKAGVERQAEWIDVVMLALDGAWRSGLTPIGLIGGLQEKLARNKSRAWPDWRTQDPNKAIEHVKPFNPNFAMREPFLPGEPCVWTRVSDLTHEYSLGCSPNDRGHGVGFETCPQCRRQVVFKGVPI